MHTGEGGGGEVRGGGMVYSTLLRQISEHFLIKMQ
jgi:hypothetical protein